MFKIKIPIKDEKVYLPRGKNICPNVVLKMTNKSYDPPKKTRSRGPSENSSKEKTKAYSSIMDKRANTEKIKIIKACPKNMNNTRTYTNHGGKT